MMFIMRFWMVVMVLVIIGVVKASDSGASEKKDHNKEAHHVLCDLMKAAVDKWEDVKVREPGDPLKKALGRTIFGKEDAKSTVETLKSGLPDDYTKVEEIRESRSLWCGQPRFDDAWHYGDAQPRWPGHSAPHDMLCLCTAGNRGWPVNGSDAGTDRLCGQTQDSLAAGDNKGWGYNGIENEHGEEHVKATWTKIVTKCLQDGGKKDELKKILEKLRKNLIRTEVGDHGEKYRLGEGNFSEYHGCTGSPALGVCVMYYTTLPPQPWWVQLQEALIEDEKLQKQREEEEKRKQQDKTEKEDSPKAEALTSAPQNTNQTDQQHRNDNITEKLRRFNLTSGTPISMPSSWLLSALLLI